MTLLEKIKQHAMTTPEKTALTGQDMVVDYTSLLDEVCSLSHYLKTENCRVTGLYMDNTPSWVISDLAVLNAGSCLVPLPPFFTPQQIKHVMHLSGMDSIITDNPELIRRMAGDLALPESGQFEVMGEQLNLIRICVNSRPIPKNVVKITFTSGTTGEPKGVMLTWRQIQATINSLYENVHATCDDIHLPLMPLAVLLENLAGVYVSLWAGGTTILPGLEAIGLSGAVGLNTGKMLKGISRYRPSTLIMTPQILLTMTEATQLKPGSLDAVRFIALGGAPVSRTLLDRAEILGLPVYEGYGLSECASVTTLNTPDFHRKGSVGKPLPHIKLGISDSGEVLIFNHDFSGYLGQPYETGHQVWHTGDLGYLDDDGYLYLTGRRRNVFITSMGRNISPEWVESELVLSPEIAQVAVFGEARPRNVAVIVPARFCDKTLIAKAIEKANRKLPDYAQISHIVIATEPFTPMNQQLSGTGRNRREAIYQTYERQIEQFYLQEQLS